MVNLDNLSVGTVAGLIAAGVFVIQFLVPTIVPLILVGVLEKENNAATWSVVGRTLHSSHWPSILRTDSAGAQGVRGRVRWAAALQISIVLLLTTASIVTPLGLYETIMPDKRLKNQTFSYARDDTAMGTGTLPRRNDMGLSRMCWGIGRPAVCPWSNTIINESFNETSYTADLPDGYDVRIPKNITEIYSSGLSNLGNTVSSVFDIQWRTYKKVLKSKFQQDGQPYLVGDYRHLSQMVLNDAWEAVAGLIVNTKSGGIGFRNHTTPPLLPFGSAWSEDLLFIEPETECINLNITLDFDIPLSNDDGNRTVNTAITDRGGFVNLQQDFPWYDKNKTWANASLKDRAYFAAWVSNVYTMLYLNVTNPKDDKRKRFQYLNSAVGKTFRLEQGGFSPRYDQLVTQGDFGGFLDLPSPLLNGTLQDSIYPNPFKISQDNLTLITEACSGSDDSNYANISNIAVSCGMVYGAARRRDGSASLLFDPGTEWTMPMYSCASASKASIKTVSFRYNGTQGLRSLEVLDIKPKAYATEEDMPLWAVENLTLTLDDANPIWGITLPENANHPNISTARQEHLYLPGKGSSLIVAPTNSIQNLAGVDFYSSILGVAYNMKSMDANDYYRIPDYTGSSNLAMYNKWQEMSLNATTAARIINLIWTDISANAVVGTKGQLPSEPLQNLAKRDEPQTTVEVPVTIYTRRVRFHIRYGIPAFLVLALSILVTTVALLFVLFGKASPSKMRHFLDQTSTGRLMTAFLYPNDYPPHASRASWARSAGKKRVNLGGHYPRAVDSTIGVALESSNAVAADATMASPMLYGKGDDAAISLQSLPSPQPYSPIAGAAQSYYDNQGANVINNSPYTYVPPGSGMLSPQTGYTSFRSGNNVSPLSSKQQ